MQEYDVIVCGEIGVDYSMVVDGSIDSHATAAIKKEVRGLGGAAGCRAKFLAERGLHVLLIGNACGADGNGRFVEKEVDSLPTLQLSAHPTASTDTPYRVLIVSPEQAYRLNYALPIQVDKAALKRELEEALQASPNAIVACQGSWFQTVAEWESRFRRPKVVWWDTESAGMTFDADGKNENLIQFSGPAIPPPGWQWKFELCSQLPDLTGTLEWHPAPEASANVFGAATADIAFSCGLLWTEIHGIGGRSAVELVRDFVNRYTCSDINVSFPAI